MARTQEALSGTWEISERWWAGGPVERLVPMECHKVLCNPGQESTGVMLSEKSDRPVVVMKWSNVHGAKGSRKEEAFSGGAVRPPSHEDDDNPNGEAEVAGSRGAGVGVQECVSPAQGRASRSSVPPAGRKEGRRTGWRQQVSLRKESAGQSAGSGRQDSERGLQADAGETSADSEGKWQQP